MRKKIAAFLAGALLTVAAGVVAQTSGVPSRLRVLSVGVGTTAPSANGNITAAGTITASNFVGALGGVNPSDFARMSQTNTFATFQRIASNTPALMLQHAQGNASSMSAYVSFRDGADVERGWVGFGTGDADLQLINSIGALRLITGNGVATINGDEIWTSGNDGAGSGLDADLLDGLHASAFCRQDGTGCPTKTAYMRINGSSTCENIGGLNSGVVSPCTRTAAGSYTITLAAGFSGVPVCQATIHSNTYGWIQALPVSSTELWIRTRDSAGALADRDFSITCVGT